LPVASKATSRLVENWHAESLKKACGEVLEVSDMETGKVEHQMAQTHEEARKLLDEAWDRAMKVHKEAKKQADIVYEEARKLAVDEEGRKRAEEAHTEALKQAKKASDAITNVAQAVFSDFWKR
jgi:vacuolar-type H+-ATPase subunit H